MNDYIIHCKTDEYINRFCVASRMGDRAKARKLALTVLVMLRRESRAAHARAGGRPERDPGMRRDLQKLKAAGMEFPFGKMRIKKLEMEQEAAEKELAGVGKEMHYMLELWQSVGATFEDLCNLCNRDPVQVRKELGDERLDESFSKLAMVYNLDYKNPHDKGWLEDSVDAPLTHALKAYLLDTMLRTEAGRKAAHEAMEAVFPEVMEHVVYPVTDEDGVRRLFDKDGNEIGTAGRKEGENSDENYFA